MAKRVKDENINYSETVKVTVYFDVFYDVYEVVYLEDAGDEDEIFKSICKKYKDRGFHSYDIDYPGLDDGSGAEEKKEKKPRRRKKRWL